LIGPPRSVALKNIAADQKPGPARRLGWDVLGGKSTAGLTGGSVIIQSILARVAVLALVGVLAAAALSGCGGGGTDAKTASSCTLGSTAGCGGTAPVVTPPVTPPVVTPVPPVVDAATVPAALGLVFSAPELPTSGASPVTVTAIVKNATTARWSRACRSPSAAAASATHWGWRRCA
jgi:hypothetical protein